MIRHRDIGKNLALTPERHDAKCPEFVAGAHTFPQGVYQRPADDVHVLAHLQEDDGGAGVLAERQPLLARQLRVLQDLVQHYHPQRRLLRLPRLLQGVEDVVRQLGSGVLAEPADAIAYLIDVDLAHRD